MPSVLVTCCNQAWIHKGVVFSLMKLVQDPRVKIILPTHRPYENSLNLVVKDFLAGDYDFWLNIDDDNPPMKNPLDLLYLDKDIIGFPTPVWANMKKGDQPYYYNSMIDKEEGWIPAIGTGLTEVDAVGSGCMLIARRVIEKTPKPLFMRQYDKDGVVEMGHDYLFCRKAKSQGFKVWTHFDYPCFHFNELEINEIISAFHQMKWQ